MSAARQRLGQVLIPEAAYDLAVALTTDLEVHGHRADIALLKLARAQAALLEKSAVGAAEVREAACFVLPHRLPGASLLSPDAARERLDSAVAKVFDSLPEEAELEAADELESLDFMLVDYEFPGSAAAGSMLFQTLKKKRPSSLSTSTTSSVLRRSELKR